jgi:hypothetical protein
MTWTDPATYSSSELVTPAKLNTHWRDNELALLHPIGTREFVEVTAAGSAELSLYKVQPVIPAGALGTTGTFIAYLYGRNKQGGSPNLTWTWRVYLGGIVVLTYANAGGNALDNEGQFWIEVRVEATGSASSQAIVVRGDTTASQARVPDSAISTSTVDLGADRAFNVTLQCSTANMDNYAVKQFSKQLVGRN